VPHDLHLKWVEHDHVVGGLVELLLVNDRKEVDRSSQIYHSFEAEVDRAGLELRLMGLFNKLFHCHFRSIRFEVCDL